jgi:hypothetical protein
MLLLTVYGQEEGFYGEEFDILFKLLNAKDKKERYLHSAVFCRSTPALKPWVVRLMQYKPAESIWGHLYPGRNYVLAVGGNFFKSKKKKKKKTHYGCRWSKRCEYAKGSRRISGHTKWRDRRCDPTGHSAPH